MQIKKHLKEIYAVSILVGLFIAASYFSQAYTATLTEILGAYGVLGMAVYVMGATIATVIAPLSFLPILPIAVTLWGSFMAAVLSVVAWMAGAVIAFLLAERFGKPLVKHLIGEKKMRFLEGLLPQHHLFLAVVFLRIALPVDLLSYALGLFGIMRFWPYFFATLLGITPFAFVFSYLADTSALFQAGAFAGGILFIALAFPFIRRRYRRMFMNT